jgi:hypothetical protein
MSPRTTALRAAIVAALTGVSTYLGTTGAVADPTDPPSPSPGTSAGLGVSPSPSPTANPGNPDDVNALLTAVSRGYDSTNCSSQPVTRTGELADVQCGQSPVTNGPSSATFSLFDNVDNLNASFTAANKKLSMASCGAATELPATWRNNSGQKAGQVSCGTAQGIATVIWTAERKNLLAEITFPNDDVDGLYNFWRTRA